MFRIIVLCTLFVIVRSQVTSVGQCMVIPADLPIHQYVHGCTNPPCLLPRGENVVIDVVFKAPRTIRSMRTRARAIAGPLNFDYPLGNNEVTCNFLTNTYCPILSGEVVQYTLQMFIEPIFPADFPVVVEFRVEDENNDPIWCIRLPISVVATSKNNRITATNN